MDTTTARRQMTDLLAALRASLLERHDETHAAVVAAIAGHHIVQIGAPGAAKSQLGRAIARGLGVDGGDYFELLFSRSTETSEVFGAKDVEAMKRGETRRNLQGSLAAVRIAMLDEVFKGHSAILNGMLGVLNERLYANGAAGIVKAPLRFAVAASNEVPAEDDASLTAFFDRFLVRLRVGYIESDDNFARLMRDELTPMPAGVASVEALDVARAEARKLPVSDGAIAALRSVVIACREAGIVVSDRRAVAIRDFLRAGAWLDGSASVEAGDVAKVTPCLWSRPDQIATAEEIVKRLAPSWQSDARDIRRVLVEQRDAVRAAGKRRTTEEVVSALTPINRVLKDLEGDVADKVAPLNAAAAADLRREIQTVRDELVKANAEAYAR